MGDAPRLINALDASVVDRLDPQFAEIYTKYQAPFLRADQVTYDEYNANRSTYTFPIAPGLKPAVGSTNIHRVPVTEPAGSIKVQVFHPTPEAISTGGFQTKDGKLPAHVDYHGGGFVIGGLESDESWCRKACQNLGCIILTVDYRMAPDFPHPVPINDSWTALKWVFANAEDLGIDSTRISIGGLSAGGNLAAVCALLARDQPSLPQLVLQLLVVPCVDARYMPISGPAAKDCPYPSYITNEFAPCLPLNRMRWFYNLWLGTNIEERAKKANDFLASPIAASSHAGLAPASFHVAGVDTLTSEGIAYHEKLVKAGVKSTLKVYEGVGHPFGHWDGELIKGQEYVRDTFDALRRAYTGSF